MGKHIFWRKTKRRSHPLRYKRLFFPKALPVTEGLKPAIGSDQVRQPICP